MTTVKKIDEKIISYLKKNLGDKTFIKVKNVSANADVWGFNGMEIRTEQKGNTVNYSVFVKNKLVLK